MTVVPLPDTPCVRVNFTYTFGTDGEGGDRLFFSYTGGPPTPGDLTSAATTIATAWGTDIAPLCGSGVVLTEVDILDIASHTGNSAVHAASIAGTRGATNLTDNTCFNLEFGIARRYRGGKPRIYLPAGVEADLLDASKWGAGFMNTVQTDFTSFITAVKAISLPSLAIANHVNLSYYQGFHNVTNSSGRTRAAPTYRSPNAIHDNIQSYIPKQVVGSQRRRRTATSS